MVERVKPVENATGPMVGFVMDLGEHFLLNETALALSYAKEIVETELRNWIIANPETPGGPRAA